MKGNDGKLYKLDDLLGTVGVVSKQISEGIRACAEFHSCNRSREKEPNHEIVAEIVPSVRGPN